MSLAELLGRPVFEIMEWPPEELIRWKGWALIQHEERDKAKREAESRRK